MNSQEVYWDVNQLSCIGNLFRLAVSFCLRTGTLKPPCAWLVSVNLVQLACSWDSSHLVWPCDC